MAKPTATVEPALLLHVPHVAMRLRLQRPLHPDECLAPESILRHYSGARERPYYSFVREKVFVYPFYGDAAAYANADAVFDEQLC